MNSVLKTWNERLGTWDSPRRLLAATLFAFSLIWLWSSGYKDGVTWAGFAYVLFNAVRRREKISCGGLGWPLLAYLAVCAVSAWTSIDPKFSWHRYWKLLELIAGFIALANLLRPGRRADAAAAAVAFAMIAVAASDCVRFALDHVRLASAPASLEGAHFMTDGRWWGSRYGFPTIAAAVHAAGFVLVAALLLRAKRNPKRIAIAAGIALVGVLLSSFQTRSVLLGIAAGFLVLLAAASRERRRAFAAIGLCSLALVAALCASPKFRNRIVSGSFSDRIGIWHDAAEIVKLEPGTGKYFGIGYGHGIFLKVEKRIPGKLRGAKNVYDHTHNMILESLVETGWPGLVAWLALLGTAAWRAVRALFRADDQRRWTLAALSAALVTLLLYGQFSAFFALAPFFLFWNLLGILIAASAAPQFQSLEKDGA